VPDCRGELWYHVGSKTSAGHTGFAHLFEHLMFEGSQHTTAAIFAAAGRGATLTVDDADRTTLGGGPGRALELALWMIRSHGLSAAASPTRKFATRDVVRKAARTTDRP